MVEPPIKEVINQMTTDLRERRAKKPDPERIALIKGDLRTSILDIRASRLLYKDGLYSLSTYHLQQAAEKATKAYFLFTGFITKQDRRNMSHDLARGQRWLFENASAYVGLIKDIGPEFSFDDSVIKSLEKSENKRIELATTSEHNIRALMDEYDSAKVKYRNLVEQMFIEFFGSGEFQSATPDVGAFIDAANEISFLFIASLLTFPHEAFSRYADNEKLNYNDYTMDMGIVKTTTDLLMRIEKAVIALDKIIEWP